MSSSPAILITILLLSLSLPSDSTAGEVLEIIKTVKNIIIELFHTWEYVAPKGAGEILPNVPVIDREEKLMSRMVEISRQVNKVDGYVHLASKAFLDMVNNDLPTNLKTEMRLSDLLDNVLGIEMMHHHFKAYLHTGLGKKVRGEGFNGSAIGEAEDEGEMPDTYTLDDFARTVVSHASYSIRSLSENIHRLIMEDSEASHILNRRGIFTEIRKLTETISNLCNIQQSPQQLLFNLYNVLQITQLKAYTMIQFSWMLLRIHDKGNFTSEAKMMQRNYVGKLAKQAIEIRKVMSGAKRDLWRCDPRRHVSGETYTEITKLLQGYIVNEVDLNDQQTCRENCVYYKHTKQHGCYKNDYCSKQPPCRGTIIGCKFVDSDMYICPSDKFSKRRYDWIEYENGRILGTKKSCSRAVTKVDSWWRWLFWHCSYCMCLCDDPKTADTERYFNLRPVISDINDNMVITGLKFEKIDRVIYIQIQQGKMLPKGSIDQSNVAWKPIDTYNIQNGKVKDGVDYHTLSWQQRALDLDDLNGPDDHVLTGIRFRKLGTHLNLEIQVSKFNFSSGELINGGEKSQWISNDNTDVSEDKKQRKRLVLDNPDVPTRTPTHSSKDSETDQFLEFTNSDSDTDAAQTTVPFIDIQEVLPNPPVPLSGAGLYHKGQRNYGGFIGLKIFTLNFKPHIQNNFPEINEMHRV